MDKKTAMKYIKFKDVKITKKTKRYKYKKKHFIIYNGKSTNLFSMFIKKNMINNKLGVFIGTKKIGHTIHNTLKKKKKKK